MTQMKRKILSALLTLNVAAVMTAGGIEPQTVYAEGGDSDAIQLVVNGSGSNIQGAQTSSVWFGNYLQSSDGNGGFNVDPIKWRVLSNADGKLFLLADQNLDAQLYHGRQVSITWENCDLRSWLNGTSGDSFFANAFSSKEQAAVATTNVVNENNPEYNTPGGNNTNDKIFLLSVAEVTNTAYGFSDSYANHPSRKVSTTAYAEYKGQDGYTNWWWLRSPGQYEYDAVDVRPNATNTQVFIKGDAVDGAGYGPTGIRPAFNLNLSAVLFTSAASGGKTCENEGTADALTAVSTYTGSEWKVTVKDDTRSAFAVEAGNVLFNKDTGIVTVPYSGASTGTNEYISVIITDKPITDSSAKIKYYGRIAETSSAEGASITVNTAGKMQDGEHLYIFNEQYNGDQKTDFSSDLIEVKRAPATVAEKPTANSLTYNADALKLVTEGTASGGTMQYAVSDSSTSAPTSGWSENIPEKMNAGTYYVWYKVIGDVNHEDSEPDYVTAVIAQKELTITANDQTFVYNGQIQGEGDTAYEDPAEIADKITVKGLEGSDAITSIIIDGQAQEIGEYPDKIVPSNATVGEATANYDITYVSGKLTITPDKYRITFVNEDGTVLQSGDVPVGEFPEYTGETPVKEPDEKYTYTFAGWDPETTKVIADATYTAKYDAKEIPEYTVTEGADGNWTKGSGKSYSITVKRNIDDTSCFDHYTETYIDGKKVSVTAESGSTIITFSAKTLDKLSTGKHTVTVKFDDGEAETTLTIKDAEKPSGPKTPDTRDNRHTGLWASMLCLSTLIFAGLMAIRKQFKKEI